MFYRCNYRRLQLPSSARPTRYRTHHPITRRCEKLGEVFHIQGFTVEWRDALRPVGRVFVLANMASKKVCCLLGNPSKICVARSPLLSVAVRGNASWEPVDKVTHTGQKFDENDKRLMRFVDKQKEVNNNWAIKLIEEVPPKPTKDRIIACDGGGGPLGHPKVYINLDRPGNHSCGYCGLRFYKEDHHHH